MDPTPRCAGSGEFVTEAQIVHCAHEERTGRVAERWVFRECGWYPACRSHDGQVRCSCAIAAPGRVERKNESLCWDYVMQDYSKEGCTNHTINKTKCLSRACRRLWICLLLHIGLRRIRRIRVFSMDKGWTNPLVEPVVGRTDQR